MISPDRAVAFTGYAPPVPKPQAKVAPMDVYPVADDSLKKGDGWAGINKPVKVVNAAGEQFVAKSNTLGAFIALHPDHNTRNDNVDEIVVSHLMADEFGFNSLTFQEGDLVAKDGTRVQKVLSPLQKDFHTLEEVPVTNIKDGDRAVALTITQGFLGDWDSTFNDSNVWVQDNGKAKGSDYGYAGKPGIVSHGVPYANAKIMKHFATRENVTAITDKLKALTDEEIHGMVERQGSKWIRDWSPQHHDRIAGAIINNRDELRKNNPYMKWVKGFHPFLKGPMLRTMYPVFFWSASKVIPPPASRPDQWLDVFINVAKYFHLKRTETVCTYLRKHVHSPEEKQAAAAPAVQAPPAAPTVIMQEQPLPPSPAGKGSGVGGNVKVGE